MTAAVDFADRCVNVGAPALLSLLLAGCVVMLVLGQDPDELP